MLANGAEGERQEGAPSRVVAGRSVRWLVAGSGEDVLGLVEEDGQEQVHGHPVLKPGADVEDDITA